MFGRLVTLAFDIADLGELNPLLVIVGVGRELMLDRDGIAELAGFLDLVELLDHGLDAGIVGKRFRQVRKSFAGTLALAGGNHAFRHAGERLGVLRIGLQHGAEEFGSAIDVAGGKQATSLFQNGGDFGGLIVSAAGRTAEAIDELADLAFRNRTHKTIGGRLLTKAMTAGIDWMPSWPAIDG